MKLTTQSPLLKYGVKMAHGMVSGTVFGVAATLTAPFALPYATSLQSGADPAWSGTKLGAELYVHRNRDTSAIVATTSVNVIHHESFKTLGTRHRIVDGLKNSRRVDMRNVDTQAAEDL